MYITFEQLLSLALTDKRLFKQYLCDCLKVKPDENFRVVGKPGIVYRICDDGIDEGKLHYEEKQWCGTECDTSFIVDLVNHPEKVIHSHWTEQDVKDAEAVLYLFPQAHYVSKDFSSGVTTVSWGECWTYDWGGESGNKVNETHYSAGSFTLGDNYFGDNYFPGLKYLGDSVEASLYEIIVDGGKE